MVTRDAFRVKLQYIAQDGTIGAVQGAVFYSTKDDSERYAIGLASEYVRAVLSGAVRDGATENIERAGAYLIGASVERFSYGADS